MIVGMVTDFDLIGVYCPAALVCTRNVAWRQHLILRSLFITLCT